jgi:hypothetical protein
MVTTVADRLGVSFDRATEMAEMAHQAGLVWHVHGTVTLTGEGQARGGTLTPPTLKKLGPRRRSEKRSTPRAKPRPRDADAGNNGAASRGLRRGPCPAF